MMNPCSAPFQRNRKPILTIEELKAMIDCEQAKRLAEEEEEPEE